MRKPTDPGGFDPDEVQTTPDLSDPISFQFATAFGNLKVWERKRVLALLVAWSACTMDRRVTIEACARELAKVPPEIV